MDGSEVVFVRINRWQNRLDLLAGSTETGSVRTILVEEEEAYLSPGLESNFRQLADGKHFLWGSERSGWRHLYMCDFQGNHVKPITEGDWEVGRVVHVDDKDGWIYFTGYGNYGFDQYSYRIKFDGKSMTKLTEKSGFHRISVDPTGKYIVDDYSSLETPRTVNMLSSSGKFLRNLASTNIDRIRELGLREPELVAVKAADNATDIHGLLFKPADFDPDKTYPLIVQVYGGPHTRMNRNIYQTSSILARLAQLGFVVWRLDNRSTTNRGKKFQVVNYLKMGQLEVDDQATGVKQITERPYIDGSHVGVYGGSYGGYMTLMALFRYPDLYHVGVAGAAPVDFYNTMAQYTERHMRTPDANPDGYIKGSAIHHAKHLKGKLLIWFGTRDINVYPQHSIRLIDRLIQENKVFDVMIYPDEPHVPRGKRRQYLQRMIARYFVEHLKPENWEKTLNSVW
jgi:dipeptidyl-peptidase-4